MPRRSVGDIGLGDVVTVDEDAAAGRLDEPIDHLQRRRLAATGRAHQHADPPGRDRQREVLDRASGALLQGRRVVVLADMLELDGRAALSLALPVSASSMVDRH